MKRKTDLNEEAIIEDYKNTNYTVTEIQKKYQIGASTINRIIKENGVALRRNSNVKFKTNNLVKICYLCGCDFNPQKAKYCCECGKKLMPVKEAVIYKLEKTTDYFAFLQGNNGVRDNFVKNINEIINIIKESDFK